LGREPILLEEGIDLFVVPVPDALVGETLSVSQIGARTGLIVIALENNDHCVSNPPPDWRLTPGCKLLMLGTDRQRQTFTDIYES
jgi:K+/H+ antiporter YhaU regulatory subunit KhtT